MKLDYLICFLKNIGVEYKINENLAPFVSIRVAGKAHIIVFPHSVEHFCEVLNFLYTKEYKFFILGNGTNVFFSEEYNGVVISTKRLNTIAVHGSELTAQCGASITKCSLIAYKNQLSGLEFAYGIPGSVGGAVYMNANAFGGSISDIVVKSKIYDIKTNTVQIIDAKNHLFSEKHSVFMENKAVVLETSFMLSKANSREMILEKMNELMKKRAENQPLDKYSAGSVFKRFGSVIPARLIDEMGLKGYSINDAEISTKHAGFIINKGNAKSTDILNLIKYIKENAQKVYDINFEEEIIFVE